MITGSFVNGLHLMVGLSTDVKPTTTSENTFFLEENTGKIYYFSAGEWAEAGAGVAQIIAAILGGGSSLPVVDSGDAGKVLTVSDEGEWGPEEAGAASVTAEAVANAIGDMSALQIGGVVSDLDAVTNPVVQSVTGTEVSIAAEDNHVYSCGEITSLTISSVPAVGEFSVIFTSGSTATTVSLPATLKMPSYTIEANMIYELNVMDGRGLLVGWSST